MDLRTRERRERLMITYGQIEAARAALNTAMHSSSATDDELIGDDYDWNAIALGFLVARGVGVKHLDNRINGMWDLLSSFNCGDRARYLVALAARGIR